jgi:hypothetical protein
MIGSGLVQEHECALNKLLLPSRTLWILSKSFRDKNC